MAHVWLNPMAVSIPVPTQRFETVRPVLEKALPGFRERMLEVLAS